MIELEKTYLLKYLPEGLEKCKSKEIIDIYIPKNLDHSKLRIRKNGDKMEMTKKVPIDDDPSKQFEHTIPLNEEEFNELSKIDGKRIHKIRYYYDYNSFNGEIDVFLGDLNGLVLADFEFEDENSKNEFIIPDFCLSDVTKEEFIAGGILCGKKYSDIEEKLNIFGYNKINLN